MSTRERSLRLKFMADTETITIEVAYALPDRQTLIAFDAPHNITLEHAVELSGIRFHYPEIDLTEMAVGIFGIPSTLDALLKSGDRVEIYRPLQIDPKEARRQRAQAESKKK